MDPAHNNLPDQTPTGTDGVTPIIKFPRTDDLQELSREEFDARVKAAIEWVLEEHHEVLQRLADK